MSDDDDSDIKSLNDLSSSSLIPMTLSAIEKVQEQIIDENVNNQPKTSSPSTGVSQTDNTAVDLLSSYSPIKSVPSITTHSPMSSGVGESVKTSTRSVSIESGTRTRSPMRQFGQTSNTSSYSILNQSTNAQVTDNLRVQHQREKQELSELNDRFRGYLDRVKVLESKNSKLTSQLDDVSKTWGASSQAIISQYSGPLDRLRQEVNESMLDEADLQTRLRRSHYNIDNYRSLIHDETIWNDRKEDKREQLKLEYEHSCAELSALQKSYKQVEDQLKILFKQREDYLQEIEQLNEQSYKATLDRIKLDLQVQTLREEIPFLNDVHTHLINEFEQLKPTNGIDTQLFYRQELEKAIRDIRRDFETLHSAQRKEMEDYYTIKIEEIQNDAKKLVPSQSRQDDFTKISEQIKLTKFELNDTQKLLINEKDKFKELQELLAKLEEEYNYVRCQGSDANDNINKELLAAQERIQQLTVEIDTILRSNITLESEINIYRRLLDSETNRLAKPPEPVLSPEPAPPSFGSELGKVFNKKIKKGPIAIKDCAPDGKCITLENSSIDKDVDVSNWTLKRRVEGSPEISYTIPYGLIMKHGSELKIYARSAQNAHHRPPSQVVNDKLESWGMGTECETKLFNEQGEEKASHSQKIVFGSESARTLPYEIEWPNCIRALYIRQGIKLESILYGAQHEQGLRPGTENVLAIIGLGKACQLISNKSLLNKRIEQMKRARDRLYQGLINQFNQNNENLIIRNGNEQCLPNTLSLSFRGINAKQLVNQLSDRLAFSTGSACHEDTKHQTMSTTLQAIGLSWELARGTIRLSTSYMTTDDEIDEAIILLTNAVKQQLSSFTNRHDDDHHH